MICGFWPISWAIGFGTTSAVHNFIINSREFIDKSGFWCSVALNNWFVVALSSMKSAITYLDRHLTRHDGRIINHRAEEAYEINYRSFHHCFLDFSLFDVSCCAWIFRPIRRKFFWFQNKTSPKAHSNRENMYRPWYLNSPGMKFRTNTKKPRI